MLQTFEQTIFLKIRELVICEGSSCRAMLNDFSAIWRTFYEHPGTGSIICVATHIVIRGRRLFVCISIKIDFDEQEYVLILVKQLFLCTSIKSVVSKHLPCLEQGQLVPAPYRWYFLYVLCYHCYISEEWECIF